MPAIGSVAAVALSWTVAVGADPTEASLHSLFLPPVYPTGGTPRAFLLADINGDGRPDLVANNGSRATGITVRPGLTDGTFGPRVDHPLPASAGPIAAGDLDGDGDLDLFAGNCGSSVAFVLLNSGSEFVVQPLTGTSLSHSVTIADFDKDGKLDLLVGTEDRGSTGVFWNAGAGVFPEATDVPGQGAVAVADFDGDGLLEWAVVDHHAPVLTVVHNLGHRTFERAYLSTGLEPYGVAIGDLEDNGTPDIVTPNHGEGIVSVFRNLGGGAFAPRVDYPAGPSPNTVAVGDITGDGHPDLLVAHDHGESITILQNDGLGGFGLPESIVVGSNPIALALADLDDDGCTDILVLCSHDNDAAPGHVEVLRNLGCVAPANCPADLNRDGVVNVADFNILAAVFGWPCP